jgi:hypothetical protein
MKSSPAFVCEPEGNGGTERFFHSLKQQLLWVRRFQDLEEPQRALRDFRPAGCTIMVNSLSNKSGVEQLQQTMPFGIVPRQARDLESRNDACVGQRDLAGHAGGAERLLKAGAGPPRSSSMTTIRCKVRFLPSDMNV